jgi:hypothetical protein
LGTAETQRFNIVMKLGDAKGTTVDVAVDATQIISQSSSSIGTGVAGGPRAESAVDWRRRIESDQHHARR